MDEFKYKPEYTVTFGTDVQELVDEIEYMVDRNFFKQRRDLPEIEKIKEKAYQNFVAFSKENSITEIKKSFINEMGVFSKNFEEIIAEKNNLMSFFKKS